MGDDGGGSASVSVRRLGEMSSLLQGILSGEADAEQRPEDREADGREDGAGTPEDAGAAYGIVRAECKSFAREFRSMLSGAAVDVAEEEDGAGVALVVDGARGAAGGPPRPVAAQMHELFTRILSSRIASVREVQTNLSGAELISFCRQFDGYEHHLVSPEEGIRRVIQDATLTVKGTVLKLVGETAALLAQLARQAAARRGGGAHRGGGGDDAGEWIVARVREAVHEWRSEAEALVVNIIEMHADYINANYFRERERQRRLRGALGGGGADPDDVPDDASTASTDASEDEDDASSTSSGRTTGRRGRRGALRGRGAPAARRKTTIDNYDILQGYLSKQNTQGHWQRRWFVLNEQKKKLYYYANQDEHQEKPPRGTVALEGCDVIDVHPSGIVSVQSTLSISRVKSTFVKDEDASSLYIKIVHREAGRKIMKEHTQVMLKTENAAAKYEWLARLREAAQPLRDAALSRRASEWHAGAPESPAAGGTAPADAAGADAPPPDAGGAEWPSPSPRSVMARPTPRGGGVPEDEDSFYVMGTDWKLIASDISSYVVNSLAEIAINVPKAIVFTMVRRAEDTLLDRLTERLFAADAGAVADLARGVRRARAAAARDRRMRIETVRSVMVRIQDIQVSAQMAWDPDTPFEGTELPVPRELLANVDRLVRASSSPAR